MWKGLLLVKEYRAVRQRQYPKCAFDNPTIAL